MDLLSTLITLLGFVVLVAALLNPLPSLEDKTCCANKLGPTGQVKE